MRQQQPERRARSTLMLGMVAMVAWSVGSATAWTDAPAFTWDADDPALEWGECPDFLPDGCGLAVLQGDPTQRNADVFFRLPGNSVAERH